MVVRGEVSSGAQLSSYQTLYVYIIVGFRVLSIDDGLSLGFVFAEMETTAEQPNSYVTVSVTVRTDRGKGSTQEQVLLFSVFSSASSPATGMRCKKKNVTMFNINAKVSDVCELQTFLTLTDMFYPFSFSGCQLSRCRIPAEINLI